MVDHYLGPHCYRCFGQHLPGFGGLVCPLDLVRPVRVLGYLVVQQGSQIKKGSRWETVVSFGVSRASSIGIREPEAFRVFMKVFRHSFGHDDGPLLRGVHIV